MIYLLWCTIRPEMFMKTHKIWIDSSSDRSKVKTIVAVNTDEHKAKLEKYCKENNCETWVVGNERIGLAYPTYHITSHLQAERQDILVFPTDDFYPPQDWDEFLIRKFSNFNGCLFVRDGYQENPDFDGLPSITLPIMTYDCLEKLNRIVHHPDYMHLFCDSELYLNVKDLGLLRDDRMQDLTTFEHKHQGLNKREADEFDAIYKKYWTQDAQTYYRRICLPVDKRLDIKN